MTDHIIDYIITDEEFESLTADQRETLRGEFGLIRCPDGSYYTIRDEKEMVRVRCGGNAGQQQNKIMIAGTGGSLNGDVVVETANQRIACPP
jgi:hypothetical protein